MNEIIKGVLAEVQADANRLHNILIRSGPVRVRLGELRDAAAHLDSAIDQGELQASIACNLTNAINQLGVFLTNCGTGLEKGSDQRFHMIAHPIVMDHLGRWAAYFNDLAIAIEGDGGDEWLTNNPLPPGQPGVP